MENDQIEEMAINIIEKEILKYSQLKSGIKKGDKEISWDGYITVFDGKGRGKDNFEYNINVQVKGRYVKKLNKGNSKYLLEKSHLLNYQKQKTGTLLLVVDFIDIENYQIYYANLLPVDLKALIDGNKSRAKKPKVNINLKPIIESRKNLLLFKKIFCDKTIPENLNIKQFGLNFIKIGKCHIAILVQKDKEGKIKINNFFENLDNIITIVIVKNNEKPSIENRTSPYFMLEAENILKFSNFNSDVVFQSLKLIQNWEKQSDYINRFMLELLKAYDKNNKRKDILELAENINNELIKKENSLINELNKFQIIKRRRDLNVAEKDIIQQLRNDIVRDKNFNRNLCGIAILLENQSDFEYYYDKLDLEEKNEFDTFPIRNLLMKIIE